jgi:hypothetical protein
MTKNEALMVALEALHKNSKHLPVDYDYHFDAITALREALAQPPQPEQEPVAYHYSFKNAWGDIKWHVAFDVPYTSVEVRPLFTSPPQREWVGLTDEEIAKLRLKTFDAVATNHEVYRAIEAKLKEKNK